MTKLTLQEQVEIYRRRLRSALVEAEFELIYGSCSNEFLWKGDVERYVAECSAAMAKWQEDAKGLRDG